MKTGELVGNMEAGSLMDLAQLAPGNLTGIRRNDRRTHRKAEIG